MDTKFVNVTVSTTLSKSIYIEIPENATEEEIRELAEKEVFTPQKVLERIAGILRQFNISLTGLQLEDWIVDDLEYIIDGRTNNTSETE